VGKSTLSTNIAGYFASRGHTVVLGDADRQQSARLWLQQRPATARPIGAWEVDADWISAPPKQATHAVLDTPAGLGGWRLKDALKLADRIIVPLQPAGALGLPVLGYLRNTQNYVQLAAQGQSVFDVAGTRVARDVEQWQGICDWLDVV